VKVLTIRLHLHQLQRLLRKSPLGRGGGRRQSGWVRSRVHNPPQGLTALAPPKRGFRCDFLTYITPRQAVWGLVRIKLAIPGAVWILTIAAGMSAVWTHELSPGPPALPSSVWPAASKLPHPSSTPVLVMLAHPRCPCTRASIGELAKLMASMQGRLSSHVLFYVPKHSGIDWQKTDLWASAQAIPGVRVNADEDGRESKLFRAATSGQTVLYGISGQLLFSGGITKSRGHSGDNASTSAIVSLINEAKPDQERTPVFGCDLLGPALQPDRTRMSE